MTTPLGPDNINLTGWPFLISADSNGDTSIADLEGHDQDTVVERFKQKFIGESGSGTSVFTSDSGPLAQLFGGLPNITGGSLPLRIIAGLGGRLLGVSPGSLITGSTNDEKVSGVLAALQKVPILGDLVEIFTGVEDGDESDLGTWVNNLKSAFGGADFMGTLDVDAFWTTIISTILNPLGLIEGILSPLIKGNLEDLFGGIDLEDGALDIGDAWSGIASTLINPLGIFTQQSDFGDLLSDLLGSPSSVIGDVPDSILPDLTDLRDGLKNAFDRITGGSGFGLSDLVESAGSQSEQLANMSAQLQKLIDDQSTGATSGITGFELFEYVNTSTWDTAQWDLEYLEGSAAIAYLAVADGHNGGMVGVSNGAATQWGRFKGTNSTTETDDQSVKVVLSHRMTVPTSGPFGNPPSIHVYCHVNAARTQWVRAELSPNLTCRFRYKNGGSVTLVTGTNDGENHANPAVGATFEITSSTVGGLQVYRALLGGAVINTWTDSSSVTAVGASNRHGGAGQRWNDNNAPGKFAYFSLTDNAPVAVTGTGFSVYRTSTSNVSKAAGEAQIANSFFGNTLYISGDLTWSDSTTELTVTKSGWYKFTLMVKLGGGGTDGGYNSQTMEGTLYVNGSIVARTPRQNSGGTGSVITSVGGDFRSVYLAVGDVVKPGVWNAASAVNLTGTADGTRTVFAGSKVG